MSYRFLRRSPRIQKSDESIASTSIQDMNLCGAEIFNKPVVVNFFLYGAILDCIQILKKRIE